MHTLLVVANPEPTSLTHYAVEQLVAALASSSVEVADLHAEGFNPLFTLDDRNAYQTAEDFPADIRAEHERLERATDIVFVFPVYWWSMPALLKGWVDRVLVNGWAFAWDPEAARSRPMLQRLTAHALPVTATSAGVWDRHGYETALRTQFEHGIVDYCGIRRGVTAFAFKSEDATLGPANVDSAVAAISQSILAASGQKAPALG